MDKGLKLHTGIGGNAFHLPQGQFPGENDACGPCLLQCACPGRRVNAHLRGGVERQARRCPAD